MPMTVSQLYRHLGGLIAEGHGRKRVYVHRWSFENNCDFEVMPVEGLGIERVLKGDDDGGTKINKDGSEASSKLCMLVGAGMATIDGGIVRDKPRGTE